MARYFLDKPRTSKIVVCSEVKSFSTVSMPLTKLTRKDAPFVWSDACEDSFQELKERLTLAPILSLPSGSGGFGIRNWGVTFFVPKILLVLIIINL